MCDIPKKTMDIYTANKPIMTIQIRVHVTDGQRDNTLIIAVTEQIIKRVYFIISSRIKIIGPWHFYGPHCNFSVTNACPRFESDEVGLSLCVTRLIVSKLYCSGIKECVSVDDSIDTFFCMLLAVARPPRCSLTKSDKSILVLI